MTLADILASLAPQGASREGTLLLATSALPDGRPLHILGAVEGAPIGVDEALRLSAHVLALARQPEPGVILFLVDTSSQRMSRRDELLGLNEYLAHLAKSLLLARHAGHRTIGLLYGGSAAGAFIATALACDTLVALPGARPEVMDLPSMARVTKLPIAVLEEKAKATPVFAPGVDNLAKMGAIAQVWDPARPLIGQLAQLLSTPAMTDLRAEQGALREGRLKAQVLTQRVVQDLTAQA
jgi:malonate decarboxylase gamma subunit